MWWKNIKILQFPIYFPLSEEAKSCVNTQKNKNTRSIRIAFKNLKEFLGNFVLGRGGNLRPISYQSLSIHKVRYANIICRCQRMLWTTDHFDHFNHPNNPTMDSNLQDFVWNNTRQKNCPERQFVNKSVTKVS